MVWMHRKGMRRRFASQTFPCNVRALASQVVEEIVYTYISC